MGKNVEKMTDREALELIDKLEEYFYFRMQNPSGVLWGGIAELHSTMKAASCSWRTLSQCCAND